MCYDFYSCPFEPDICTRHVETMKMQKLRMVKIVKLKNYKCTYNSYSFDPIIDTPSIVCYYDIGQNRFRQKGRMLSRTGLGPRRSGAGGPLFFPESISDYKQLRRFSATFSEYNQKKI